MDPFAQQDQQLPQLQPQQSQQQSQVPPELLQLLLSSGGNLGNAMDKLKMQQMMAERLREGGKAQNTEGGRTVNNGRTFVANGWGETGAKALSSFMGGMAGAKTPEMMQGIQGAKTDQMQQVLSALLKMRGGAAPSAGQDFGGGGY